MFQKQDLVSSGGCGATVSDYQDEMSPADFVQHGDKVFLGLRIERRGRLIENQDRCLTNQRAGDRQTLLLPN